ncbi:transposase [Acidovorax sp. HMWF029]|uniref:transposase n=1 Tax=Acidovorax sp. HMWF029 TaxID=2056863 RepID=UPI000D3D310B|nr:transposase [Acidovorax sp. HMWF029]PTT18134.1 transposase [Acidovorax sp. HMWF029]
MARLPRLTLPGHLHHVIQRGNNRQPIFQDGEDFHTMLALLADNALQHGVAVHAYVLMDNHFHLLVTPAADDGLPKMMQAVGRRYVQYFNRRHARTGTLWEGRYRSTVLQPDKYMLPCMVYLDLNPVRAGMVANAADYPWSSHAHWLGVRNDRLLTPHALYWALGNTPFAREAAYAALVLAGIGSLEQAALTASALSGWALGDADFIEGLQKQTPRRVVAGQAGRPKIVKKSGEK